MRGEDLRDWRLAKGWSQAKAASELGYSRRQYIRHEQRIDNLPKHLARTTQLVDQLRARQDDSNSSSSG